MTAHRDVIVEQFTRQAVPFSTAPAIRDERALALLVESAAAGPDDLVLDVACGPGLVVCAFARVARHATGVDVTPAMIARARVLERERAQPNVSWSVGEVGALPYRDGAFSVVVSRFAFHHFPDPPAVLAEMRRVCRPGGRVAVMDLLASDDPVKAAAFHRMERLRDPSHVRALTLAELRGVFHDGRLPEPRATFCRLEVELEGVLARSFPDPADVPEIRRMFADSVADDALGLGTRWHDGDLRFTYTVAIFVSTVPGI